MNNVVSLANWLIPLVYLAVMVDYGAAFFLRIRAQGRSTWLAVILPFHLAYLVLRGLEIGRPPLVDAYEVLSVMALSMTLVYGILELIVKDRRAGVFIFIVAFLFQYTSSIGLSNAVEVAGETHWSPARLHTLPAILAYTALTLAGVYGLLHVMSARNLKRHRFGMLFDRLPALDLLGRMTWWALLVGFAFITVSMITGPFLFKAAEAGVSRPGWEPRVAAKIIVGSIAWLVCLVAILGKLWRGKSMTWVSEVAVAGFGLIVILLLSSVVMA